MTQEILVFHKPKGVIVTRRDERGRKTVYDILPAWVKEEGWVPVGRLDKDTRGLLLFVKNSTLVNVLLKPGRVKKKYEVWVRGQVTENHLKLLRDGIPSPVGLLQCEGVKVTGRVAHKTKLEVVLSEGKNRQIRRMFGALKDEKYGTWLKVLELKRTEFGPIKLDVPSGAWRFLRPEEQQSMDFIRKVH